MTKHCAFFEHTADVGLEAKADTVAELFEALAERLASVICSPDIVEEKETRHLLVEAEDLPALAVDFLSEVLNLLQSDLMMISRVTVVFSSATALRAEIWGEAYDAAKHELGPEIKAVTYHQLQIEKTLDHWFGRVMLDL